MIAGLEGKRVLVTGGATGIGGATSAAFAAAGATVAIHYNSGAAEADALVADITASGGMAEAFGADLTQDGAVIDLIDRAASSLGGLDILVNNAGGMVARKPLEEVDDAFFDTVMNLNVRQMVHCCRAAVPYIAYSGGGSIITCASISARTGGSPGSSIYSASKAFVATFTRSLARELAPRKIRVNCVSPGTIDTAFHARHSTPEKLEGTRQAIPLQRLGLAEDCAGAFLYLASEVTAGYVTGQVIEVNGGQLMA